MHKNKLVRLNTELDGPAKDDCPPTTRSHESGKYPSARPGARRNESRLSSLEILVIRARFDEARSEQQFVLGLRELREGLAKCGVIDVDGEPMSRVG